jgi:hypothetical protein
MINFASPIARSCSKFCFGSSLCLPAETLLVQVVELPRSVESPRSYVYFAGSASNGQAVGKSCMSVRLCHLQNH